MPEAYMWTSPDLERQRPARRSKPRKLLTSEEHNSHSERVIRHQLPEPERSERERADPLEEVDKQREHGRNDDREPACGGADFELQNEQLDALLDVDDADVESKGFGGAVRNEPSVITHVEDGYHPMCDCGPSATGVSPQRNCTVEERT